MKLNGALKPHRGAPAVGRSISGAKKYRGKRCQRAAYRRRQQIECEKCGQQQQQQQQQQRQQAEQQQQSEREQPRDTATTPRKNKERLDEVNAESGTQKVKNVVEMRTNWKQKKGIPAKQQQQQGDYQEVEEEEEYRRFEVINSGVELDSGSSKMLLNSICEESSNNQRIAARQLLISLQLLQRAFAAQQNPSTMTDPTATRTTLPTAASLCVGGHQQNAKRRSTAALPKLVFFCLFASLALLPQLALCDDGDQFFAVNGFSIMPETTTPEFDYASRGQKKFGDKCENTLECGFPGSICDPKKKSCQCTEDLPVTNHIDKCGKEAAVNESCFFNEQCEVKYFQTECRDGRCICRFEMTPIWAKDGSVECKSRQEKRGPETYIDPAMIGVLVGMALMFIIICVVLRLFSQARWRENRTIFNTPNPRLMNVSLLRDSKLLHGQERRGSRMSVRAPSRQPSMASLRPHSPNPSLGKTGSRSGSNASATSVRSVRGNSVAPGNIMNSHHERKSSSAHHQPHQHQQQQQHEPLITNITANPGSESVRVEIVVPEKK